MITIPFFKIAFWGLLFFVWWVSGYLGVRFWLKFVNKWQYPVLQRTAIMAGLLAGPLCWLLGIVIHWEEIIIKLEKP